MKMSSRLIAALVAALVLPLAVPGFTWLLHPWPLRALFAFGVTWVVWSFFQPRGHVSITRELDPRRMAFWSVFAAALFTAVFTLLWGVVGNMALAAMGLVHGREDIFRSMTLFAICSFLLITRHYLRKHKVI